jgi:hypothetical protein
MELKNINSQIQITVSSSIDRFAIQRVIGYLAYLEATAKSKVKKSGIDELAIGINSTGVRQIESDY